MSLRRKSPRRTRDALSGSRSAPAALFFAAAFGGCSILGGTANQTLELRSVTDGSNFGTPGASSERYFLDYKKHNNFHFVNAFDGDEKTAWVEGQNGPGIGATLHVWLQVPMSSRNPVSVDGIQIKNGFPNPKYYAKNNRVKQLAVEIRGSSKSAGKRNGYDQACKETKTFELADRAEWQVLTFKRACSFDRALNASFRIVSVYNGTNWDDTPITEIRFTNNGRPITLAGQAGLVRKEHEAWNEARRAGFPIIYQSCVMRGAH